MRYHFTVIQTALSVAIGASLIYALLRITGLFWGALLLPVTERDAKNGWGVPNRFPLLSMCQGKWR